MTDGPAPCAPEGLPMPNRISTGDADGGATQTTPNRRLLTVREAATQLGWKPLKLRRWIAAGRISSVRCGRSVHVAEADLESFIASHRVDGDGGSTPIDAAIDRLIGSKRVF